MGLVWPETKQQADSSGGLDRPGRNQPGVEWVVSWRDSHNGSEIDKRFPSLKRAREFVAALQPRWDNYHAAYHISWEIERVAFVASGVNPMVIKKEVG